jgi:hypothetical protein
MIAYNSIMITPSFHYDYVSTASPCLRENLSCYHVRGSMLPWQRLNVVKITSDNVMTTLERSHDIMLHDKIIKYPDDMLTTWKGRYWIVIMLSCPNFFLTIWAWWVLKEAEFNVDFRNINLYRWQNVPKKVIKEKRISHAYTGGSPTY